MSDPQAPPAQPPKKGPGCIVTGGGGFLLFCFAFVGWSQLREAWRPRVVMLYARGEGRALLSWDEGGASSQIAAALPWERRIELPPGGYVQLAVSPDRSDVTCEARVDGVAWRSAVATAGGTCRVSGYLDR